MPIRILAACIAVALLLGYVGPLVWKMGDLPLSAVILVGLVAMLVDLWQTLNDTRD